MDRHTLPLHSALTQAQRAHSDPGSREGAGWHHLLVCFESDGAVSFYPETADPAELAQRLATVVRLFVEEPGLLHCVAEDHAHPAADPHPTD